MTAPKHLTFAIGRPLTAAEQKQLVSEDPAAAMQAATALGNEAARLEAANQAATLSAAAPATTIVDRLEALSTPAKAALGAGVALLAYLGLRRK